MQPRRSNLLLILLVITPVALLTWLGTYLIRDAARSTDRAQQEVLEERLMVADHQILHDLRVFTDHLDSLGNGAGLSSADAARQLSQHPWVAESWVRGSDGQVQVLADKKMVTPAPEAETPVRVQVLWAAVQDAGITRPFVSIDQQAFVLIGYQQETAESAQRRSSWITAVKSQNYHLKAHVAQPAPTAFPSGWHVSAGDFIYWRFVAGQLIGARVDGRQLTASIYQRLPIHGVKAYAGRLQLKTRSGIPLNEWGNKLEGSLGEPVARRTCSAPLLQWELAYTPADIEFPKPYLFPILLGVGSGCILVLALAWTFFRENARELRLAQQRVSFVNQISHELKTPLTNIRLYTEMAISRLEDEGDSITVKRLQVVETEVARLDRLIHNVLNYARQQRDKLTVQLRTIVLDDVIRRAVGSWQMLLEEKGFTVETHLAGPEQMRADSDALEQILGNLLSNVDKYAGYGRWVAVRSEVVEGLAKIIVEDRGPGIPAGKRRNVFEPFERLRADLNEGVSGTGIGLTISRELAELHGGSLEVCPHYKDGARFILTLPLSNTPH